MCEATEQRFLDEMPTKIFSVLFKLVSWSSLLELYFQKSQENDNKGTWQISGAIHLITKVQ